MWNFSKESPGTPSDLLVLGWGLRVFISHKNPRCFWHYLTSSSIPQQCSSTSASHQNHLVQLKTTMPGSPPQRFWGNTSGECVHHQWFKNLPR
jgi:hypothetical protein